MGRVPVAGEYDLEIAFLVVVPANQIEEQPRVLLVKLAVSNLIDDQTETAKKVENSVEETLTYRDFPYEHWTQIRANNAVEQLNRETRRRTHVVSTFPGGNSALMLVCARLRHVTGTQQGSKKYMNMEHLDTALEDVSIAG